jgi:hypothetical protein
MKIHLEGYARTRAPKQGIDLHELVRRERSWLEEPFPDTVTRYRSIPTSIKNVARAAMSEQVRAFVIRSDRHLGQALGVATLISNQTIIHPDETPITGIDTDYWIGAEESTKTHHAVAKQLVLASAKLALKLNGGVKRKATPAINSMFVAVPTGPDLEVAQTYNLGLQHLFEAVGRPAVLTVPGDEDPHGITKDGAVVQLFRRKEVVQQVASGAIMVIR